MRPAYNLQKVAPFSRAPPYPIGQLDSQIGVGDPVKSMMTLRARSRMQVEPFKSDRLHSFSTDGQKHTQSGRRGRRLAAAADAPPARAAMIILLKTREQRQHGRRRPVITIIITPLSRRRLRLQPRALRSPPPPLSEHPTP